MFSRLTVDETRKSFQLHCQPVFTSVPNNLQGTLSDFFVIRGNYEIEGTLISVIAEKFRLIRICCCFAVAKVIEDLLTAFN